MKLTENPTPEASVAERVERLRLARAGLAMRSTGDDPLRVYDQAEGTDSDRAGGFNNFGGDFRKM